MSIGRHPTLDNYQRQASKTAIYPHAGSYLADLPDELERLAPLLYLGLKLSGEAGEVSEKIGKALRDGGDEDERWSRLLIAELGDVLWYVSQLAEELGFKLSHVAEVNLAKLSARNDNGTLGGSGDER